MGNHSNINNMFIPYELALRLKELGFNEKCFDVYSDVKSVGMFRNSPRDRTPKILWQQAFYFFIDNHGLISWIYQSNINLYHYSILRNERYLSDFTVNENTYEEARLECLKKLIEIVENKLQ